MTALASSQTAAGLATPESLLNQRVLNPLTTVPVQADCSVCVAIPARNEAATIGLTLTALAQQIDLWGKPMGGYEILLLANNCSDGTAKIAQYHAQICSVPIHVVECTLPPAAAYVGRSRQMVMDEAYRRLMTTGGGIIATTDGDTQVSPTWIAAIKAEIARGADAVGGRIVMQPQDFAKLPKHVQSRYLWQLGYQYYSARLEQLLDPAPGDSLQRHHQHCGASFALTTQAYAQVGGLPAVRSPEDIALYQALRRIDARFCHSPKVKVTTSGRLVGRTDIGQANQLAAWASMDSRQPLLVESAASLADRFQTRQMLRQLWQRHIPLLGQDTVGLASRLGMSVMELEAKLAEAVSFGYLLEQIEQQQTRSQHDWPLVSIQQAVVDLRQRLRAIAVELNPAS